MHEMPNVQVPGGEGAGMTYQEALQAARRQGYSNATGDTLLALAVRTQGENQRVKDVGRLSEMYERAKARELSATAVLQADPWLLFDLLWG